MFVYAFAKALEQKGFPIYLSTSEYALKNSSSFQLPTCQTDWGIRNAEIFLFNLTLPSDLDARLMQDLGDEGEHIKQASSFLGRYFLDFPKKILRRLCKGMLETIKKTRIPSQGKLDFRMSLLRSLKKSYYSNRIKIVLEGDPILFHMFDDVGLISFLHPDTTFMGYFQDLFFFDSIREILMRDLTLKIPLFPHNQSIKETILNTPNSCFLHVRRGDYLAQSSWSFVKLGASYYEHAIKLIKERIPHPCIFIFSNEIQWCKDYFIQMLSPEVTEGVEFRFVCNNGEGDAAEEMELMRSCKNAIIANSTFSWWAAYLMKEPTKVIITPTHFHHPSRYFTDILGTLIPKDNGEWIAIDYRVGSKKRS